MRNYSSQELGEALEKLPKPLADFLQKGDVSNLYLGMLRKHQLNLRQADAFSKIVNVTLLGLEPESALETNLHQGLPELSSGTLRELIEDINDRIFKEARRRVQENIVAEEKWDEEELGPKPKPGEEPRLLSDEELDKLAEEQKRTGWKPPEEIYIPPDEPVISPIQPQQLPDSAAAIPATGEPPSDQKSIVVQKLSTPTVAKATDIQIVKPGEEVAEKASPLPTKPPVQPHIQKGDPYREPIE